MRVKTTLPETSADYRAAQAIAAPGANPADPPPSCNGRLIDQKVQTARVGEMHRWFGVQNYFFYGQSKHAESHLGIGVSNDDQHWSGDAGSVFITDSGTRTENRLLKHG